MPPVKVRYRFRCYPSVPQQRSLAQLFGCVRLVYNRALAYRRDAYEKDKTSISYGQTSAALTQWKREPTLAFLNEVSCVPLQQCLRQLNTAYVNFFEKRASYPRFRSKHGEQSAEFTSRAFAWEPANRHLSLSKIGALRVRWSREFTSNPSTVTITKDCAGRYFVSLCLEETVEALPKTGQSVGIDLGVAALATLSTGETLANPRHLGRKLQKLARAQRVLSRRRKGSGRWERQRLKVARMQAHLGDSRRDHLSKVTSDLVRRFDVLCIEDLNVRGMMANRRLSRAIADVGLSTFRGMLAYKCAWHGRELKVIDRFEPSSKRCSACGVVCDELPLAIRSWTCACGAVHDRDHNAARNILAAGLAVTARGGCVSPRTAKAVRGRARRSVNRPALS